jgi:hypothetical protein
MADQIMDDPDDAQLDLDALQDKAQNNREIDALGFD